MAASIRARTVSECSEGSGANDGELLQELGLLEAIYIHELNVDYNESGMPSELCVILHPATAGNVDQQYVCLTLSLRLPDQYPNRLPEIAIRNSRGVSDEHLASLDAKLKQLAKERRGGAMLYELIEVAKESLTNNNTPSCQCVICLHGFTEDDVFTRTHCYHYFHSQCLARYIRHALENEEEPVCAVCREPLNCDLSQLEDAPPPRAVHEVYSPDKVIRAMQRRMAALYRRQKEKGGIIDIEAENKKYLINISQTPTLPVNVGISPVMAQLKSGTNSQNDTKSDKVPSKEEGNMTRGSTGPTELLDKKEVRGYKGDHPERPRSSHRSDYKQGGRIWGRGRGSRGRGHTRPYSSGAKDNYSKVSGFDRKFEFKGQRPNDKGSVKHQGGENTNQSHVTSNNENVIDQSKALLQAGSEKVLADEISKGQHPGRQQRHQGTISHLSKEEVGRTSEEKIVKLDKEVTKVPKTKTDEQKSGETKQEQGGKVPVKCNKSVNEVNKSASTINVSDKKRSTLDEDCLKRGHQGQDSDLNSGKGSDDVSRQNRRPTDKSNGPKLEAEISDSESKMNRKRAPKFTHENFKGDSSIHGDQQFTDSAVRSATGASHESGKGQTHHGNRNRRWEPRQSKDSFYNDKGRGHRSKVKPDETDARKGSLETTLKTKTQTTEDKPSSYASNFAKSKLIQELPAGFGKAVKNDQMDRGQKSVRPPPGFENVKL